MLLALAGLGAATAEQAPMAAQTGTAQRPPELPPIQVVVLIDESGSLKEEDVAAEKDAARTISASVLAPGSMVSVVGFGSANGPGQNAVDVPCPPTPVDRPQARDQLAKCIGDLHRRTPEEGNGTDHVAALQQALAFIGSGGPDKKIVFALTDGKLDVSESPAWGDTPQRRNDAAALRLRQVLDELDRAGAQVWPLGFGSVDQGALRDFAKGHSCTPAAPDPQARVTASSAELRAAVSDAFTSASCVKYGPTVTGRIGPHGTAELAVDIPAIASDASIIVYKQDRAVQVEYLAPDANGKPAPAAGGSAFEFAGQTTETESVRITDPTPGRWIVRLASADAATREVAATVVYQAAVKANLNISPPAPAAGQTVDVDMQVWARGGPITDPATLQGLAFTADMSGGTGVEPRQTQLSDPDQDGTFSGQFAIPPGAAGQLTFVGTVTGIGIGGDTRQLAVAIRPEPQAVTAQILFDTNRAQVTPGGTVTGTIDVSNDSGQPARLRLLVADPSPGTVLTVDPGIVEAAPGHSTSVFTLRFGADSAIGSSAATLRLVDDADPAAVIEQRPFITQVEPEPGVIEKLWWLWVGLAVLAAAALVVLASRLRARNDAIKVRGLKAQLLQGGFVVAELEPREPNDKQFRFIKHEDFTGLQLQTAGPGETQVFEVRRSGREISLRTPTDSKLHVLAPGARHPVGENLEVAILDERGMAAASATSGPVQEVSFDPFASPAAGASADPFGSGPPGQPVAADPFGGAHAGSTATVAPPAGHEGAAADPFGDPFAGRPATDEGYFDPNNPFR